MVRSLLHGVEDFHRPGDGAGHCGGVIRPSGARITRRGRLCERAFAFIFALWLGACYSPDPRTLKGAIAFATEALAAGDGERLFLVIDERSRHALHSIVHDRRAAASLVQASYPPRHRPAALRALGTAAGVSSPAALFALRCERTCRAAMTRALGAPISQQKQDGEVLVTTARGQVRLRKGSDTWYGLVWRTEALARERTRANADLARVRANAALYARQKKLR